MNSKENECLHFLRDESERLADNWVKGESRRFCEYLNGWEVSNTNNVMNQNRSVSILKAKLVRSTTPTIPKKPENFRKVSIPCQLTFRDNPNSGSFINKPKNNCNYSFRILKNNNTVRRKPKNVKSRKVYEHCSENLDFSAKKYVIIHNVLPEKCRISGTVPVKYTFLKNPVRINTKDYFVLDSALKDL